MQIPNAVPVGEMDKGFEPIPEATYNLEIETADYVAVPRGKDAKGPYTKVRFTVIGPGDIPELGRKIFEIYTHTGKGTYRLRELLTKTGHDDDFVLEDTDQLIGLKVGALVIIEENAQYGDRNRVSRHVELVEG